MGKGEIAHNEQFLLFPTVFSIHFEDFLPFLSNFKLSSANSLSLVGSTLCHLVKNFLQHNKILALTKLKADTSNKFIVAKTTISVFDRVENIVGKRRKFWLPAFSPFRVMFSKALCFRAVKNPDCLVKG